MRCTLASLQPLGPSRRWCMQEEEPAASYNAVWVDAFVERLSRFDARMNQAVVDAGVLAGVPRGALARAGAPGSLGEPFV